MELVELQLSELPNPLLGPPWTDCAPIDAGIVKSIAKAVWIPPNKVVRSQFQTRYDHICRIAWLVGNYSLWNPITIMKTWPANWPIKDGNHRVAAAYVKGLETIRANVL